LYIVGLHNDEDSGVCLLKDGILLDAISEERLNRTKLYKGPPKLSLQYILERHKLNLEDINYFAYGWHGGENNCTEYAIRLEKRIIHAINNNPKASKIIEDRIDVEYKNDTETVARFKEWASELGIPSKKIVFLDHHKSHAWSAFCPSPFCEAIVFTFDGRGDLKSASVSLATQSEGIKEYDYLLTLDSLGYLYGKITNYLGFTPHRHEGKVTGLAAYGDYSKTLPLFNRLISWEGDTITANLGFYKPFHSLRQELIDELDKFSRNDIASGVQKHCENLIVKYIKKWVKKINRPEIKNVCLAGGVFANVKINQRVSEIEGVDNIYVFPHMGDGGLPVGGACHLNYLLTGQTKIDMPTVYLGNQYSNDEISNALEIYIDKIVYEKLNEKVNKVVDDLIDNKVVGYFDNKMEYGPRALGARSILYHARDKNVNDWLNKRLKRSEFMPFAPVTPIEYADKCYNNWNKNDVCSFFMTKTYNCTEEFRSVHKAVVHVDNTARPQVVTDKLNGNFYKVTKLYCDKTGEKALINTSFNQHEEPIVCTVKDAVESLLMGSIDVLYLGHYRVWNNKKC
tara:strand:+ start:265 stop:1971 length:1707 start_codon:yes stop_codon:yes gene_type:complete